MLIIPSLPADITLSPLWSNVTLCTSSVCPDRTLTSQELTSTILTRLSLQATTNRFPAGLKDTWLAAIGPATTVDIGRAGCLMSQRLIMPWQSHEAMTLPVGLKEAWLQGYWCPWKVTMQKPSLVSHTERVWSAEAVRRRLENGRKLTLLTEAVWPRSVSWQHWLSRSHNLAVLSAEQEARRWPEEWKEQPQVGWPWPESTITQRPAEKSHRRTCRNNQELNTEEDQENLDKQKHH